MKVTDIRQQVEKWRIEGKSRGQVIRWLQHSPYNRQYTEAIGMVTEVYEQSQRGLVLINDEKLASEMGILIDLGSLMKEVRVNSLEAKRVRVTTELVDALYFNGHNVPSEERGRFEESAYDMVGIIVYGIVVEGRSLYPIGDTLPNNGPANKQFYEELIIHSPWNHEHSAVIEFEKLPEYKPEHVETVSASFAIQMLLLVVAGLALFGWLTSYVA